MSDTREALRILLTVHHRKATNAGAAGVTLSLADEYRQLGHEVRVLGFDDMGQRSEGPWDKVRFPFFVAREVSPLLKGRQIDVLDCSTGDASALRRRLLRQSEAILVTRSHGLEHRGHDMVKEWSREGHVPLSWKYPIYNGGVKLRLIERSIKIADRSFFLNQRDKQYATEAFGLAPDVAVVVRNGLPPDMIGLPFDAAASWSAPALAFVGTFDFRKGADTLVAAASEILRAQPGAHLTLLGTGGTEPEIASVFEPTLRPRITVVPRYQRHSLPGLLRGHQILLFPSRGEGFGTAIIEAMACGLVPIASDTPGPRDILAGTESGILVPIGDAHAMTSAASALLDDRPGLEGRRRTSWAVAQRYAVRGVAEEQLAQYRSALAERRAGVRCSPLDGALPEARHGY